MRSRQPIARRQSTQNNTNTLNTDIHAIPMEFEPLIPSVSGPGSVVGSDWLRAWRAGDRIPVWARFSAPVQTGPEAHPTSCTMGTRSFPGVKSGRGLTLTSHPLWTVRPVQSFSVCTRGALYPYLIPSVKGYESLHARHIIFICGIRFLYFMNFDLFCVVFKRKSI